MNGQLMGQLLPRQFHKSRARAQILLLTLRSLHLISQHCATFDLTPLTLLYSTQTVDSNLDGNVKAPSVPAQRVITAHLMRLWPSNQYVLGGISLSRSEQTLGLQSSQHFKACPADPDDTIFGSHFPTPGTDFQVQADPSLKEKAWHLTWMPLAFLASLRPQRQPTRFTGEIWVNFFCQALGAPIPLLLTLSHARNVLARNLCSISTGITCSLVRSTLGPSPAMITS